MIRLSANVITSAIALFVQLDYRRFTSLTELPYYKIESIGIEEIVDFSRNCGWVASEDNIPTLTSRGKEILQLFRDNKTYQLCMLKDYIVQCSPIWGSRIPYGRKEAVLFMTDDEKACFAEAGLLSSDISQTALNWWDNIAAQIRGKADKENVEIGRAGEENTIKYEQARIGITPKWISIESNLAGYDVQSQVDKTDVTPLLIEVKASKSLFREAWFYITSNEWAVASTSKSYIFHIWLLSPKGNKLAIIYPKEIFPYIPTNNLGGKWESAKIPFSCFEEKFIKIS